MSNYNYPCGIPRTTEEQIADLYYRLDKLAEKFPYLRNARGEWAANQVYKWNDWVTCAGSSYLFISHTEAQGIPVTNAAFWQLIAAKGDTGATGATGGDGVGIADVMNAASYVSGDKTVTPLTFELTDGTNKDVDVYAQNGAAGASASITGANAVSHRTEGAEEITTVQLATSTGNYPFEVHAYNGQQSYMHLITLLIRPQGTSSNYRLTFVVNTTQATPYAGIALLPEFEKLPCSGFGQLINNIYLFTYQITHEYSVTEPLTLYCAEFSPPGEKTPVIITASEILSFNDEVIQS